MVVHSPQGRRQHHGRDPNPDGIGQAVPDGGQLGHQGKARAAYEDALHDVWLVVNRLQTQGQDGGIGNRPASP
jgi:hypothetical protein